MKKAKNTIKTNSAKALKSLTEMALINNANSSTCITVFQPKAPKGLSKFSKIGK